jgi:hypothetical protein
MLCDYVPHTADWECDPDVDPRHPDNHICADCAVVEGRDA